jgi:hypothetical protein
MSTYLRKCIDIAPTAITNPFPAPLNDFTKLVTQPWWPRLRATTSYARILADWPSVQPTASPAPSGDRLDRLDKQVEAAYADGLKVILVPYRYPRWTNGTDAFPYLSPADNDWMPQDRVSSLTAYLDWKAGRRGLPGYKAQEYGMPTDGFKPGSRWAEYVQFLWDRYADRLTAFEVVNEPNGQIWPQRSTVLTDDVTIRWGTKDSELVSSQAVADMMVTVDGLARRHPNPPLLLAPSCSDSLLVAPRTTTTSHTNRYRKSDDPFAESLLAALDARGFVADDRWIWSYHNYSDLENNFQHVVDLRHVLAEHGWTGRQLDGGPEVWCTEGGCRMLRADVTARMTAILGRAPSDEERLRYQALFVGESLARHHSAKGAGTGVGMLTQYTLYNEGVNAGLLDQFGTLRPSFDAWCSVPEYHAAPVQRNAWRPQL